MMNKCKRMTVQAVGKDKNGTITIAENGNTTECLNIKGGCGCVHAEEMLLMSMPHPVKVFVTHSPCLNCAMKLVHAEVEEVVYGKEYRDTSGIDYLRSNGVIIRAEGDEPV